MPKTYGLFERLTDGIETAELQIRGGSLGFALSIVDFPEEAVREALLEFISLTASVAMQQIEKPAWKKAFGSTQGEALVKSLRLIELVGRGKKAGDQAEFPIWDSFVLWSLMRPMADAAALDREEFCEFLVEAQHGLDHGTIEQLDSCCRALKDAFDAKGIERGEYLRTARQDLNEVMAAVKGQTPTALSLLSGFLHLFASYSGGDAPHIFQRLELSALHGGSRLANTVRWAASRIFAARDERVDALDAVGRIVRKSGEFLPWIDLARLTSEAGNKRRARSAALMALTISPLAAIFLIAEPVFEADASALAAEIIDLGAESRSEVTAALGDLAAWRQLIGQAEQAAGRPLVLERDSGLAEFADRSRLLSLSPLDVPAVQSRIRQTLQASKDEANDTLSRAIEAAQKAVDAAAAELDKSQAEKDAAIRAARRNLTRRLGVVRIEQKRTELEGRRAEKGCVWSFEFALVGFGIYIVAIAVLAFRGNSEAWKSPIAFVGMALALIPVTMSVILQAAYIIRKAGVDASIAKYRQAAETELENKLKAIDMDIERSRSESAKKLAEAEAGLQRLESVRAMLESTEQPGGGSFRLVRRDPSAA